MKYLIASLLAIGTCFAAETATDKEAMTIEMTPDGSKIIKKADGTSVEVKSDGTKVIKKADGTSIEVRPDGTKSIQKPDGSVIDIKTPK